MISVIVPIYNVENYLEACLKSILSQTYTDFEVLCVNDCTLDNSINIVKKYMRKDTRIRLITHQENRGLGGARNTGIEHAKGEYLLFVDSDDMLTPQTLEKSVQAMVEHHVEAVVFGLNQLSNDGVRQPHSAFHIKIQPGSRVYSISKHKERLIEMWPSAWNKLYRTELVRKYKCSFPEKLLYEDHFFFYHYFANVDAFYYIDEPLYDYRISRPGSITSAANGRENEVYQVLDGIKPVFQEAFPEELWEKAYAKVCFRLIWERQNLFLASWCDWRLFCTNAEKWLLKRFDREFLEKSVGVEIGRMDAFYRFMFLTGRKRRAFRIKIVLREKKLFQRLRTLYWRIRAFRTTKSYIKELIWVCWNNKAQLEKLLAISDSLHEDSAI